MIRRGHSNYFINLFNLIVNFEYLLQPAAIVNLRPWTSEEVLGDITVAPDCSSRILRDSSPISEDQIDHKLPSPEEQQQVIALK